MKRDSIVSDLSMQNERQNMISKCENNPNLIIEELKDISLDGEEFWHKSSLQKLKDSALHQTFRIINKEVK